MNILDRAIDYFSPRLGVKRMAARQMKRIVLDGSRQYDSAKPTKGGWYAPGTSANAEISIGGRTLRARSRDLARNNEYTSKAIKGIAANVVGSGIRPSFQHTDDSVMMAAKKLWKDWAEERECDLDDRLNFYGIQFMIMRAIAESGEVLVKRVRNKKGDVPFQLQVLEADFIDDSKDGINTDSGGFIRLGVEFDRNGRRVAYWLFSDHPGENKVWKSFESVRVPATEILHLYFVERPGQVRGIPFGVSTFDKLRDFKDYEKAQLIRQKIAACFSVFVHTSDGAPTGSPNPNGGSQLEMVEPGIIEYLQPNQEVTFGNPPPVEGFGEYARKTLQGVAAGYDITYELLTNDLSNVNFSSGRMGWIEFGRMVRQWQQQIMIQMFCKGVFKWFKESLTITGGLTSEIEATWTPPRREMIDPLKETKGISEGVRSGLNSLQSAIRELGRDPEVVFKELAEDKALLDSLGLKLTTDPEHDPNRSDVDDENDDEKKISED